MPQTIAGRTVLILLIGLTLSHALSTAINYNDRANALSVLTGSHAAERIATIAKLVDESPLEERERVLAAVNNPTLRVSWGRENLVEVSPDAAWETRLLQETLTLSLESLRPGQVRVSFGEHAHTADQDDSLLGLHLFSSAEDLMHIHTQRRTDNLAAGRNLDAAVQLSDGSWLNFAVPLGDAGFFLAGSYLLSMALMVLAVLGMSIWAVRRLTAPMAYFARASERLGRDVYAPPLPEKGPQEIRQVTSTFNKMQERIRRFVEDRTEMVAAISHDLRTPITRLRLRAEFLEDEDEKRKMFSDLDEMESMIESTLAFARDDATQEPLEDVDLSALVQRVCHDFQDTGADVDFAPAGRLSYGCHPTALRRAFANLIGNALKYGERARVSLEDQELSAAITIEDQGPGIPKEEQERVFMPFFRLENSRSRNTGGTGLGLTVARTIIHAHGGDVTLKNRTEGGLKVVVTLPKAIQMA